MDATPNAIVAEDFDYAEHVSAAEPAIVPDRMGSAPSLAALNDIPVKVQAVLGGASMLIDQLLGMRAGAVVELDRRVGEPIDVIVNGRLVARGELVVIDGALGITLTEIVKQEG